MGSIPAVGQKADLGAVPRGVRFVPSTAITNRCTDAKNETLPSIDLIFPVRTDA
jgi:hypothetical protein